MGFARYVGQLVQAKIDLNDLVFLQFCYYPRFGNHCAKYQGRTGPDLKTKSFKDIRVKENI